MTNETRTTSHEPLAVRGDRVCSRVRCRNGWPAMSRRPRHGHGTRCTCAACQAIEEQSTQWPARYANGSKVDCPHCGKGYGWPRGTWTHSHINCRELFKALDTLNAHAVAEWAQGLINKGQS
jgi:hypothetical protein